MAMRIFGGVGNGNARLAWSRTWYHQPGANAEPASF
jgi:hypothetical protein